MGDKDKIQAEGRKDNAAEPLNASDNKRGPERYPSVRQDDAVEAPQGNKGAARERRSFDPAKGAPSRPPQGAGDAAPASANNGGRLGPAGDPAEGKR